jgi:opacity protein-like surface antigen
MKQELIMIRKTILFMTMILCLATMAQAQLTSGQTLTRQGRWDLSLQTRYIGSQDVQSEGGSSISFQDNLGWGFGFHYNFNQKFSLGMDFSWHSIYYNALVVDAEDPSHTETYSSQLDASKFGVSGNWNILEGPFTPYANAGVSWAMVDTNIFAGWGQGCYWDPIFGYLCGAYPTTYGTDAFAYNFGVGGRFEFTKSFFVKVGYEYGGIDLNAVDGQHLMRIDIGFMN